MASSIHESSGSRWGMRNSATPSRLLAKHAAPSHFLGLAWLGCGGWGLGPGLGLGLGLGLEVYGLASSVRIREANVPGERVGAGGG
eukprot:scaffold38509_cov36-Phaeocystis_antarctica.AAC.1